MKWYSQYASVYNREYNSIDKNIINRIKSNITSLQSDVPLITVSVIGYNEEKHLVSCLWSLSDMKCKYPVEIIGIDNNSKDNTAQIFKDCGVKLFQENKQGCGYARSCGLYNARGKYHINIDSDTMYPPKYVEIMSDKLMKKNTVAVSSLWSYIPDKEHPKFGLIIYEFSRDLYLFIQSFKRPELSVRGLVFAYNIELARKVGIRTDIIRGEDGSLALGLKKYGKILFLRNRRARAITGYDTMKIDGTFFNSFRKRIISNLKNYKKWGTSQEEYKDDDNNLVKH